MDEKELVARYQALNPRSKELVAELMTLISDAERTWVAEDKLLRSEARVKLLQAQLGSRYPRPSWGRRWSRTITYG